MITLKAFLILAHITMMLLYISAKAKDNKSKKTKLFLCMVELFTIFYLLH